MTLYLPRNTALVTYYKYGPTPDDATDHWYAFMYDGQTGAQIFQEVQQTRVVLHLCDGQRGMMICQPTALLWIRGGRHRFRRPLNPSPP